MPVHTDCFKSSLLILFNDASAFLRTIIGLPCCMPLQQCPLTCHKQGVLIHLGVLRVKPQQWDGFGQALHALKHAFGAGDTSNWPSVQLFIRLAHLQLLGKQSRQLHSGHPAAAAGVKSPLALCQLESEVRWVISCHLALAAMAKGRMILTCRPILK